MENEIYNKIDELVNLLKEKYPNSYLNIEVIIRAKNFSNPEKLVTLSSLNVQYNEK